MKTQHLAIMPAATLLLLAISNLCADTHYVSSTSAYPTPPYTNWTTAATNIQAALAVAATNDVVLVTNGVYGGGVYVSGPLTLLSVNGPLHTVIDGDRQNSYGPCVELGGSAILSGFTLTNGSAGEAGGVSAGSWPSGDRAAVVTNCVIVGNSTGWGAGGAFGVTLYNSILADNRDGGAYSCTLYNCTLTDNWGCGACSSTLYNCLLTGNRALGYGGGAAISTLYNCTLTGNAAPVGGGAHDCTLYNCIVYANTAESEGANYDSASTLNYCCTLPLPTNGTGNLAVDPQLASLRYLSANSPCRGAGSAAFVTGTDLDGEPWANPPSIGCDEVLPGAITGPLTVGFRTDYVYLAPGYAMNLTAQIEGRTTQSLWDFGDGTTATNQPITSRAWATRGDYRVALWAFNETRPEGVCATLTVHVGQSVHFVDAANTHPAWPFTSWASAATNIQDAVDAAGPGSVVWVTNGVYASGARAVVRSDIGYNRVLVDRPLTLRSVNGPQSTLIDGGSQMRCAYLANGSVLSGFTLANGYADESWGGGVWCDATAVVSNCLVVGNSVVGDGGGAYGGSLYDCALIGNTAYISIAALRPTGGGGGGACSSTLYHCTLNNNEAWYGGGASYCTLSGCTLVGNSVDGWMGWSAGGGAYASTLNNCIVYFNTCTNGHGENYQPSANLTLNYCCTTPLPTNGLGNITNAPLFVDTNGWGNLRLQSNSPCINAGNNAYASGDADLDGNPRIAGATVDVGAYEFQGEGLSGFPAWLWQYGQPIDGSANAADPDHDYLNNWQEWVCATCPTNSQSALRLLSPTLTGTNLVVTWSSVAGMNYYLERSTNLASPFSLLATNLVGQEGFTSYEDTNSAGLGPFFYRVGVTCR